MYIWLIALLTALGGVGLSFIRGISLFRALAGVAVLSSFAIMGGGAIAFGQIALAIIVFPWFIFAFAAVVLANGMVGGRKERLLQVACGVALVSALATTGGVAIAFGGYRFAVALYSTSILAGVGFILAYPKIRRWRDRTL